LDMVKTGAGMPGSMREETPGEMAYAKMGSVDEYDTQGLTNAASVVDHYLKTAYDAGSAGMGFDDNLAYEMMDHLKQFSGEMGSLDEASPEAMDRMSGLSPVSSVGSLIDAARRIISALKGKGFEEEDIFDYIMDKVKTLSMDEALFEAKKEEEEEAPEDVDIDVEAPVEYNPDPAGTKDTADTSVDVNMDGVPDIDTGSPEFKKAFTTLIDAYNAGKPVGDPKYTQMLANTVTYFNKNMILKPGQPQA
jgi:hypothetical protein